MSVAVWMTWYLRGVTMDVARGRAQADDVGVAEQPQDLDLAPQLVHHVRRLHLVPVQNLHGNLRQVGGAARHQHADQVVGDGVLGLCNGRQRRSVRRAVAAYARCIMRQILIRAARLCVIRAASSVPRHEMQHPGSGAHTNS